MIPDKLNEQIERDLEIWRCNLIYTPDTTTGKALRRIRDNITKLTTALKIADEGIDYIEKNVHYTYLDENEAFRCALCCAITNGKNDEGVWFVDTWLGEINDKAQQTRQQYTEVLENG